MSTAAYRLAWRKDQHFGRARTVSAVGTRRRLQALSCNGWSLASLARSAGLTRNALLHITHQRNPRVRKFVADRVSEMYERLWDQQATGSQAVKVRNLASAKGWLPPMAWLDIDDPDEKPDMHSHQDRSEIVAEEYAHLKSFGESDEQIAERLGIKPASLKRALERAA